MSEILEGLPAQAGEPAKEDKEIEAMFQAGLQFGYYRRSRQPKMAEYIYGIKNNVEVFDLEKTRDAIRKAESFLKKIGEAKKNVLWVGTKPSAKIAIEKTANELSHSFVASRWVGGTLTNAKMIRDRIKHFEDLKKMKESGEILKYTKKEQLKLTREIKALHEKFSGIENLRQDLEAIIIVDPKEEKTAFSEARRVGLPMIAILSSDNDPTGIEFPIPANDSAPSSIEYILNRLKNAYADGARNAIERNG
jgi:small subunit ribosomal protein S2